MGMEPEKYTESGKKRADADEKKNHVALALTGKIAFASGRGLDHAMGEGVVFHAPDGRFWWFDFFGNRFTGLIQFFSQLGHLLRKMPFLLRQLATPGFEWIRVVAVPGHGSRKGDQW